MPTDEELVAAVARGKGAALEALCHRWDGPLYRFFHRYTGGRDVEDLVQDTWLRVVRAAARFDPRLRFSTWLFQIAVNRGRDWHRRPPPPPEDPVTVEEQVLAGPGSTPAVEAGIDVRRLLGALPEAQRSVVLLRYYHDLSEEEVARILGCPRGTVKSRLHQGMLALVALAQREDGRV
jgi:RNA polymerase sigma-70 factor (ECF subfamily)